jgi:predicted metal-dependent hydrolase
LGKTLLEIKKTKAEALGSKTHRIKTQDDLAKRLKLKEVYKKELAKVLERLPRKYHEFIKLFIKKEY